MEQVPEKLSKVRVVRLVIETQGATKVKVGCKLSCDKEEESIFLVDGSDWLFLISIGKYETWNNFSLILN